MLNNLTIVIITYNRPCFLKRLLTFYQEFKTEMKILVLDSSSSESLDNNLINQLKSKNITWKRYDQSIFFVDKISQGVKYIDTKYAVLCADDDFLFPTSLDKAIDFLSNNNDYSSCLGLQYKHKVYDFFFKSKVAFRRSAIGGSGSSEELCSERVFKYLSGGTVYYPMYAVHSTEHLTEIWKETGKVVSDWGLSEVFPCSVSLCLGKMKVLKIPYTTRETNSFTWYDDSRKKEMYSPNKVDIVKARLAEIISKKDNVSIFKGIEYSEKSIDVLLQRTLNNGEYDSMLKVINKRNKLKEFIFSFITKHATQAVVFVKYYIIYRATPLKYLSVKTGDHLRDSLLYNDCSQSENANSRKDY